MKRYLVLLALLLVLGCVSKEIPEETRNGSKIAISRERFKLETIEKKQNETLEEKKRLTLLIRQATPTHITSEKIFAGDLVEVISQDGDGKWISFTKINIERPDGLKYERMTNEFGIAKLKLVKEGNYKIKTHKEGYKNYTTTIKVEKFPPDDLMDYPLYTGEYAKPESDWIEEKFSIGLHTEGKFTDSIFLISIPKLREGGELYPIKMGDREYAYLRKNFWTDFNPREYVKLDTTREMIVNVVDTENGAMLRVKINRITEYDNEFKYICWIKVPREKKYPDLYPYIRNTQGNVPLSFGVNPENREITLLEGEGNTDIPKYWKYQLGLDRVKESLKKEYFGVKFSPVIDVRYDYKNNETSKNPRHPTYGKLGVSLFWIDFKPNLNNTKPVELKNPIWNVYEYENKERLG
ncbi:MAG: hypothetical protein ACE5K4_09755 [Candidatus Hydrothermarchaeota archaeon]